MICRYSYNKNIFLGRFSIPMAQMAEVWITNFDAWELLSSEQLMSELRTAVSRSFRDKGVRPYIRDLKPATHAGRRTPLTRDKIGIVIYVGTQKESGFPIGILYLSKGILRHPDECKRNEIVPLDAPFRPRFQASVLYFLL